MRWLSCTGRRRPGYLKASEAMVNVRATLGSARAASVIDERAYGTLIGLAKALYYPTRTYAEILTRGAEHGLPTAELEKLQEWLSSGKIDLKRRDALEMLSLVVERERMRWAANQGLPVRVRSTTA
ncbi:MAG: hypothetical protein BMS9Abin37_0710 [Acidobacteriota bacterium]|nr:MAG: hypothetical protein BMS9Abin37_0710 [Acidobacteriota bacterium]